MKKRNLLFTAIAILGFTTITIAQVPSYVPANGLVGWWPFNGNANDESGNGNNGTVNGATLTTDRFGVANKAYDFDGVDDFIELSDVSAMENIGSMTWSAWITCRSNPNNPSELSSNRIISKELENVNDNRMTLIVNSNSDAQIFQFILNSSTNSSTASTEPIIFDSLYFITVVYDYSLNSERLQIYLNANLISQTVNGVVPSSAPNNPYNLKFGSHNNNTNWDGKLDDIGIWNRALTACEISDLYNSQLGSLNTSATQTQTALDSYTWPINSQTYTQSGTYTAVIPNAAGCDSTITLDLSLDFTGIENNSQGALFSVFPNPAQSLINIKVDSKLIGSGYTISDNTGRAVLTGKLNSKVTTIELNNLSGGIYMFSVGENMKQTFKVIKE
jgi:hypothetical protein